MLALAMDLEGVFGYTAFPTHWALVRALARMRALVTYQLPLCGENFLAVLATLVRIQGCSQVVYLHIHLKCKSAIFQLWDSLLKSAQSFMETSNIF